VILVVEQDWVLYAYADDEVVERERVFFCFDVFGRDFYNFLSQYFDAFVHLRKWYGDVFENICAEDNFVDAGLVFKILFFVNQDYVCVRKFALKQSRGKSSAESSAENDDAHDSLDMLRLLNVRHEKQVEEIKRL